MMSPKRNISALSKLRILKETLLNGGLIAVFVNSWLSLTNAGVYRITNFSSYSSSFQLEASDSLCIAIKDFQLDKCYFHAALNDSLRQSRSPDVYVIGPQKFKFIWADSMGSWEQIKSREVWLTEEPFVERQQEILANLSENLVASLHAVVGPTSDLISYSTANISNVNLRNSLSQFLQLNPGSRAMHSLCWSSADTFFLMYRINGTPVILVRSKVVSNASKIEVVWRDTVAISDISTKIYYSAIAVDSIGNVLVTWLSGPADAATKTLNYSFYSENNIKLDSAKFADNASDAARVYYYEDAPVVSYAKNRFAVTSWDENGILLHDFVRNGNNVTVTSKRIIHGFSKQHRYPTIAANSNHLIVAWKGDVNGDGILSVEGVRFSISSGNISDFPIDTFCFSDPAKPLAPFGSGAIGVFETALNAAIDSLGNIALCWDHGAHALASIWRNSGRRYEWGTWLSMPLTLNLSPDDSVVFFPSRKDIDFSPQFGLTYDSIRVSASANLLNSAPWIALTDSTTLAAATRGPYPFFQLKLRLRRNSDYAFRSPVVRAISLPYNVKPKIKDIDSLKLNGVKITQGDLSNPIVMISRRDSVECFFTVMDPDSADTLHVSSVCAGRERLNAILFNSSSYNLYFKIAPFDSSNTLYECELTTRDRYRWQAVKRSFYMQTRNSVPLLRAWVMWDSSHSGQMKRSEVTHGSQFTFLDCDSMIFYYIVTDTNDLSITAKTTFKGGDSSLALQGTVGRFVFRGDYGRREGDSLIFSAADPDTLVRIVTFIRTRNSVPILKAWAFWDSGASGIQKKYSIDRNTQFTIQQTDSIQFYFTVIDTNDKNIKANFFLNGQQVASVLQTDTGKYIFRASNARPEGDIVTITAADRDTSKQIQILIGTNHFPRITKVLVNQKNVSQGDSIGIMLNAPIELFIAVDDTDRAYWDTIRYRFTTASFDTIQTDSFFTFMPNENDEMLRIIVSDLFGKSDTFRCAFIFPWLEIDSQINPQYYSSKKALKDSNSLIIGSLDTIKRSITLVNSGKDTLVIDSISFKGNVAEWLWIGIPSINGYTYYKRLQSDNRITVLVAPLSSIELRFVINVDKLRGDGIICDTLSFRTNDSRHPIEKLPICVEYNDLPFIVSFSVQFSRNRPYWLEKSKASSALNFKIPPHARVNVGFSEPIDSISALAGIRAYSVLDSVVGGSGQIKLQQSWTNDYRNLILSPIYSDTSRYFKGIKPPAGLYIPTDSIRFVFTTRLTDKAVTPSGPNSLDINQDKRRDISGDTSLSIRIDSVLFTVAAVEPDSATTIAMLDSFICVRFTDAIYADYIDTSKINNRSFIVTSRYYGANRQIPFEKIVIERDKVLFRPSIRFAYGDSIHCRFRSYSAREALTRYPIDVNKDGIAMAIFDTTSTVDDFEWFFYIEHNRVSSVEPKPQATGVKERPVITIRFAKPLLSATFDTDTSITNRSFRLFSKLSGQLSFKDIQITPDSLSVIIEPRGVFFSNDSVSCEFAGFSDFFSYDSSTNYPLAATTNRQSYSWYFYIKKVDFYTYPNPFKEREPQHCNASEQPCGIWFKNLHSLGDGLTKVIIVIYNIKGYPLFDSEKAGLDISFLSNNPDKNKSPSWKWDTRNQLGDKVASGIYFYAIFDSNRNVLAKGKLIIRR